MTVTDLTKIAKAAAANAIEGESYLTQSYIQNKENSLHDIITAAYYAGRASMAANIYETENPNTLGIDGLSQKLLNDCYDCIRYFV